ncbi:MAG: MFS transporter [Acidobacteria bacterium]|nr:MFS transporter [Acidobacteriota bacterium]
MSSATQEQKGFYGWWISAAAFFTFGLAVGIPYYGMGFYYDYYQKAFGWTRPEMTLGFPLAVVLTLWVGPTVMHRFSPRKLMMIGVALTALSFIGFSKMTGDLTFYYGMWTLYTVGYILSGPIPHQIIISQWFKKNRGKAMAATYLGVGVFGGLVVKFFATPITQATNFQNALFWTGIAVLLVIPIAFLVIKDKPFDVGQTPDGLPLTAGEVPQPPRAMSELLRQPAFWLLMVGSLCSIGSIGSINFHMKLVFKEQGFTDQKTLDAIFGNANLCILFSSIGGRIVMGYLADKFNKKYVMLVTYALVAATIPLLFLVTPANPEYVYLFAILFGFGMGADYMLIPLMAAEQFGVNTLARAMAIILPADTIGQTWFPYLVSHIRESSSSYGVALNIVFAMAALGAAAILLLPLHGKRDETLHVQEPGTAPAGR